MQEMLGKVKHMLGSLVSQIELDSKLNCHDINIMAENYVAIMFNDLFGYSLKNANVLSGKANQPAFDLIDKNNRVLIQVTSEDTVDKITGTISDLEKMPEYKGWHLMFVILTSKKKKHTSKKLQGKTYFVEFDYQKDVFDMADVVCILMGNLKLVPKIYCDLDKLLGSKDISYWVDYIKRVQPMEIPTDYMPRYFMWYKEGWDIDYIVNGTMPVKGTLFDFVSGKLGQLTTNKLVIFSVAQNGKTTELKNLYNLLLEQEQYGVQYLAAEKYMRNPSSVFLRVLPCFYEQGQVILLDGIDELNDEMRNLLLEEIKQFCQEHQEVVLLVSCRSNYDNGKMLADFTKLQMLSLGEDEILKYLKNRMGRRSDNFMKYMSQHEGLCDLLRIPFYLITMTDCYVEKKSKPDSQEEILAYLVERSLCVKEKEGDSLNMDKQTAEEIMTKIALVMQFSETMSISCQDLVRGLHLSEKEIYSITRYTICRKDAAEEEFSFIHNGLKEHFVAKYLKSLSYDEILELVCYNNGQIPVVHKNWYNAFVLAVSYMDNKDEKKNKLISWIVDNEPNLLLLIDQTSITPTVKREALIKILDKYKRLRFYPNDMDLVTKGIVNLCFSADNLKFLLKEYHDWDSLDSYLAILADSIAKLDIERLKILGLDKKLENSVFAKIEKLGSVDKEAAYVLYTPFYNSYFQSKDKVRRLISLEVKTKFPFLVKTVFRLLAGMTHVDDFVDYIISHEKYLHDYRVDGATCLVPREDFYRCWGNIDSKEALMKMWHFIPKFWKSGLSSSDHHLVQHHISKLLDSSKPYVLDGEMVQALFSCWKEIGLEYVAYGHADSLNKLYHDFRQFFMENVAKPDFLRKIKDAQQETNSDKQYELLVDLQAWFMLRAKVEDLSVVLDSLPSSSDDCVIFSWLVNNYDKEWIFKHYELAKEKFPNFTHYAPDERELKEKVSIELLFDYERFRELVLSVVATYKPLNPKDLRMKVKEADEEKWDSYVGKFMLHYYDSETGTYNIGKIITAIKDKTNYELFLLLTVKDFREKVTVSQTEVLKNALDNNLTELTDISFAHECVRIAMDYEVRLDNATVVYCLRYAAVRRSRDYTNSRDSSFLAYAEKLIGKEELDEQVISLLTREVCLDESDYLELARYAIEEGLTETMGCFLKHLENDEHGYSLHLLNRFLELTDDAVEYVKYKYDNLPDTIKPNVLHSLVKYETEWVSQTIEKDKKLLVKVNKKEYLRCCFCLGNIEALKEVFYELSKDIHFFGHDMVSPIFEGYSIEALPYFGQLLDLSFKMDRYQNWTSSILNIMEEMSAVSSDDSEKVVDLLRSKAEGEQTWLNRIIEDIKYKYLDSQYKCLSVLDACRVVLAKKW